MKLKLAEPYWLPWGKKTFKGNSGLFRKTGSESIKRKPIETVSRQSRGRKGEKAGHGSYRVGLNTVRSEERGVQGRSFPVQ
jgi:hypothetical protein